MSYHFFNDLYAYLKNKWWGKPFVIILMALIVLFTVWNSLPDASKEKLLGGGSIEHNNEIPVVDEKPEEPKEQKKAEQVEDQVELVMASMTYWEHFREGEWNNIQWGYDIELLKRPNNLYGLPATLVAYDPVGKKYYHNVNAITIHEFNEKVKNTPGLPEKLEPYKWYEIVWTLQNFGNEPVTDFELSYTEQLPDSGYWLPEKVRTIPNFKSGEIYTDYSDLYSSLNLKLPEVLNFKMKLKYKYKGVEVKTIFLINFDKYSQTFKIVKEKLN